MQKMMTRTEIQSMTANILTDYLLPMGTRDWKDYEKGKLLLERYRIWEPQEWEQACITIAEYVGV